MRKTRSDRIMLAYPYTPQREHHVFSQGETIVQPKLQGERCILHQGKLLSSSWTQMTSLPHLTAAAQMLQAANPAHPPLDGELYAHNLTFQDTHSIVSRTRNLHPQHQSISLHVFDLILDQPQVERLGLLGKMATLLPAGILLVNTTMATTDTWRDYFDEAVSLGYEGIIFRHPYAHYKGKRQLFLQKLKPRLVSAAIVEAVIEGQGAFLESTGALLVRMESNVVFHVGSGSGFTHASRQLMWAHREELPGKTAMIRHEPWETKAGVPGCAVLDELIWQGTPTIEGHDFLLEDDQ